MFMQCFIIAANEDVGLHVYQVANKLEHVEPARFEYALNLFNR